MCHGIPRVSPIKSSDLVGFLFGTSHALKQAMEYNNTKHPNPFYGWVLPDGTRVPCEYALHIHTARLMGEPNPESAGWLHFGEAYEVGEWGCEPESTMTRTQLDVMVELYNECDVRLPFWVQDIRISKR